jgi:hypothetical protein
MNVFSKLMIGLAALLALGGAAPAQSRDNDGCSNATLRGDYAFRVSGEILTPTGGIAQLRDGVAMTHFDGNGGLTQVDFVVSNPAPAGPTPATDPVTGFHTDETGTYEVFGDCTGKAEIDMPPHPGGAVIKLMFVIGDHGRTIHTIVTSLTPPGANQSVPVAIHSDAEKVGESREDRQ